MEEITTTTTAPSTANIYAALAAAQAEFQPVRMDKRNPHFGQKYASLASILASTRGALNAHGISVVQKVVSSATDVTCTTVLIHASGETLEGGQITIPLPKNPSNPAQVMGSALTYARRYSLSATLCVAAEEDDDGNGVDAPAQVPAAPACPAALRARAEEAAKNGISAYKDFFNQLERADRNILFKSGVHTEMKALAQEASHE